MRFHFIQENTIDGVSMKWDREEVERLLKSLESYKQIQSHPCVCSEEGQEHTRDHHYTYIQDGIKKEACILCDCKGYKAK